ncbi:hypothetical protein BC455_18255 [Vibrio harveyi]|nr:hypothetical protein BC455_18255 [Vibrio harveyi]
MVNQIELGPNSHGFVDEDGNYIIDTTPDSLEIFIEGTNCTNEEFLEWFLTIEEANNRFDLCATANNMLIDIGGSGMDFTLGTKLTVEFDAYFNALIELRISQAKRAIDQIACNALRELR